MDSMLLERLAELQIGDLRPVPPIKGLYVVYHGEHSEPVIAAFRDETLADELARIIGGSVSFEPVADDDLVLLRTIVAQYHVGLREEGA